MADDDSQRKLSGRKCAFAIFLVFIIAVALTVGLLLNHFLKDDPQQTLSSFRHRVNCHPHKDATEESCIQRGCLWRNDLTPKCSFPERYGYVMSEPPEETAKGLKVKVNRLDTPALYGMEPDNNLTVIVEYQTDHRLRVKIVPTGASRYEVPEEALNITSPDEAANESTRLYDVTLQTEPVIGVIVTRRSTNTTIFNTGLPGMAVYPQFLQLSALLNTTYIYGFGEHRHESFRHDLNHRLWSIFTRDVGPDNDWNLYGAHPVYMNVEDGGTANMVLLKNSNAMEVSLQPDPIVTFRTIGGVLDFYIFLGDSPGHAVSLYTQAIGRPVFPPYWAMGFQLSRWGYANISDMQMVIKRNRAAGIPYDVQWADIDSLYHKLVFTVDKTHWAGLPAVVQDLKDHHQHFVIIVDPGIGANQTLVNDVRNNSRGYEMFRDGDNAGVYVKNDQGSNLIGEVWPGLTVYPDYTNASVVDWFFKYVSFYRNNESIPVDALWIDMNEPSSFIPGSVNGCTKNQWDYPPYVPHILGAEPDGKMFDKTMCMTSQQAWGKHYDVHNLYAHSMAMRTNQVLKRVFPGKRPWAVTRSSFAGTGHYVTKWTGDNQAKWPAMHWSIIAIMEFGMFGFAFNGADICGFWYEPTYELCIRWHQLGAFYPFARNHNGLGDAPEVFKHQDPAAWDNRFVGIVKKALMTRYKLLPYLYTCLYRAHRYGDTVMRAMLFEFPVDMKARDVDRQFLLGPALLVSPVLDENATSVDAYFPDARWFEYFTGEEVTPVKKTHTLDTPLENFNLHLRGGYVIPWQTPANTTYESRKQPMGLIVALDQSNTAQGSLYLDDGESEVSDNHTLIEFSMRKAGELRIRVTSSGYNVTEANQGSPIMVDTVELYGLQSAPVAVTVDGKQLATSDVRMDRKVVKFFRLNMDVMLDHVITWAIY